MENNQDKTIVYLTEERVYGFLISMGAFMSRIQYVDLFGNNCDELVENDEFEVWEEPFTYEQE